MAWEVGPSTDVVSEEIWGGQLDVLIVSSNLDLTMGMPLNPSKLYLSH